MAANCFQAFPSTNAPSIRTTASSVRRKKPSRPFERNYGVPTWARLAGRRRIPEAFPLTLCFRNAKSPSLRDWRRHAPFRLICCCFHTSCGFFGGCPIFGLRLVPARISNEGFPCAAGCEEAQKSLDQRESV